MDPRDFSTGGRSSPKLQGPRPTPLKVNKDSVKIKKPPVPPQSHHHLQPQQQQQQDASNHHRQTVVIYTVSPKVIHTTVNDFMGLVQRLTGPSPRAATETSNGTPGAGDVSPAARLASLEKASPSERDLRTTTNSASADNILEILEGTDAEMSRIPGILTPEPATLLPISPAGLFSPAMDPFLQGSNNMFITSPSILFSSPIISPNPAFDLFNPFFDY